MRLLLDECVPQRLRSHFSNLEVYTVEEVGLLGVRNGRLLRAAAEQFDVLLTVDRNMPFQQNLVGIDLAVIILVATPCRYPQLLPLIPQVLSILDHVQPGEFVEVQ